MIKEIKDCETIGDCINRIKEINKEIKSLRLERDQIEKDLGIY